MGSLINPVFDYGTLSDDLAKRLRERENRIIGYGRQTVEIAGKIGGELLEAQAELEHGQFLAWVSALGMSKSAAYRTMDIAKRFGTKLPKLGNLPLSAVHKLAAPSTPEPVREEVIQRLEAGERLGLKEVEDHLWQAKEADRKAREEAKMTKSQRAHRKRAEKRQAEERAQREEVGRKRQERVDVAVFFLQERLGGEFGKFVAMLDDIDTWTFIATLRETAAGIRSEAA